MKELAVISPAFHHNNMIPRKYSCIGDDVNPALKIENVPERAKSLVLVVDDPDAPMGTWDHWVVWNIPPAGMVGEDAVPDVKGLNSFGKHSYGGPCPPSGTRRYFFKIYALGILLNIALNSRKKDVEKAMEDHVLAKGELGGLNSRK
jgi:hypothetical protein